MELIVGGKGASAFAAFYKDSAGAKRYESEIRKNATRFHGGVQRRGRVTVVWVRRSLARARIKRCVFGSVS